jgi:hypothetical protein
MGHVDHQKVGEAGAHCAYVRVASVRAGSPPPASNDTMGCDRGTRLSVLWIHLHPVQPRSHPDSPTEMTSRACFKP